MPTGSRAILAIPADTHGGSTLGLINTDKQWVGKDEETHIPSPNQRKVWEKWKADWHFVKRLRGKGRNKARLIVVHNGDAIEGDHHNTRQIVSKDYEQHKDIHVDAMTEAEKIAGGFDQLYYISGTETHVGPSEDAIAKDLGAVQYSKLSPGQNGGRWAWWHLQLDINGLLFDIGHHGLNVGRREWTRENTLRSQLKSIYINRVDRGKPIPRYVIRSHVHVHLCATLHERRGDITGIVTPAFQLKTAFGHKVGSMEEVASVGMLIIEIEGNNTIVHCSPLEVEQERRVKA